MAAIGLTLSMGLQACGSVPKPAPAPRVVAKAIRDTPPAELLRCPTTGKPFPIDAEAILPGPVREALIDLAKSNRARGDQLYRLIEWVLPGACSPDMSRAEPAAAE